MALKISAGIEMTHDEKINKTKQEISAILMMLHAQISQGMKVVESAIIQNQYGLAIDEVRAAYGYDVGILDDIGAKASELLSMVDINS